MVYSSLFSVPCSVTMGGCTLLSSSPLSRGKDRGGCAHPLFFLVARSCARSLGMAAPSLSFCPSACTSPTCVPCAPVCPANFPTFQQANKSTCQQVEKLASTRQHHIPGGRGTREPSPPVTRPPPSLLLRSPALTSLCNECILHSL